MNKILPTLFLALFSLFAKGQIIDTLHLTPAETKLVIKARHQEKVGIRLGLLGVTCAGVRVFANASNIPNYNALYIGTGVFMLAGMITICSAHRSLYKKGLGLNEYGVVYRF